MRDMTALLLLMATTVEPQMYGGRCDASYGRPVKCCSRVTLEPCAGLRFSLKGTLYKVRDLHISVCDLHISVCELHIHVASIHTHTRAA